MKAFLNCIVLILIVNHSYSQKAIIKVAPAFSLRLESQITKNSSFHLGARYTTYSFFGRTTITSFSGGIRFYVNENMKGFYGFPLLTITNVQSKSTTLFSNATTLKKEDIISYGIIFGHQWINDNGLTIDVGLGVANGKQQNSVEKDNSDFSFFEGVHPKFTLAFGYAWMD